MDHCAFITAYRKTAKHEKANYPQIVWKARPSGSDRVSSVLLSLFQMCAVFKHVVKVPVMVRTR